MNILMVSNKAVFEGYWLAVNYLGQQPDSSILGNITLEKRKEPLWIGTDTAGNQVYTLGNSAPERVAFVYEQMARVDDWQTAPLMVVPYAPGWARLTVFLAGLASIPLIGGIFNSLARAWTNSHQAELQQFASTLSIPAAEKYKPAAKPLLQ